MKALLLISMILSMFLAYYYKFKKKDMAEALWYLGLVIMLMLNIK